MHILMLYSEELTASHRIYSFEQVEGATNKKFWEHVETRRIHRVPEGGDAEAKGTEVQSWSILVYRCEISSLTSSVK